MSKNKHNTKVGSNVDRSDDRIKETGEVFTPESLCDDMVADIPVETLRNPDSKFLDNSAGCGNFLVALRNKLLEYHSEEHILNHMLYAVELMPDNHKEICERLGVSTDHPHYLCGSGLDAGNYTFGESGLDGWL